MLVDSPIITRCRNCGRWRYHRQAFAPRDFRNPHRILPRWNRWQQPRPFFPRFTNAGGIQIGDDGIVIGDGGIVITDADDTPCCCEVVNHGTNPCNKCATFPAYSPNRISFNISSVSVSSPQCMFDNVKYTSPNPNISGDTDTQGLGCFVSKIVTSGQGTYVRYQFSTCTGSTLSSGNTKLYVTVQFTNFYNPPDPLTVTCGLFLQGGGSSLSCIFFGKQAITDCYFGTVTLSNLNADSSGNPIYGSGGQIILVTHAGE